MDKVLQQERTKARVKRYRERQVLQASVTLVDNSVTALHPIMEALVDPIKRGKLEKICASLDNKGLGCHVFYGCGKHPIPMDIVSEMLTVTNNPT